MRKPSKRCILTGVAPEDVLDELKERYGKQIELAELDQRVLSHGGLDIPAFGADLALGCPGAIDVLGDVLPLVFLEERLDACLDKRIAWPVYGARESALRRHSLPCVRHRQL